MATELNELESALNKYFNQNKNFVQYYCSEESAQYLSEFFNNGTPCFGDSPDLFITLGEQALIVEHFEADCFLKTRRGSAGRRELAEIEREIDKISPTEQGTMYHKVIAASTSLQSLIANIESSFEYHYSRIDNYRESCKASFPSFYSEETKVAFVIENTSPYGTVVFDPDNDALLTVSIHNHKEFLDYLSGKSKVDYILYLTKDWNNYNNCFLIDCKDLSGNYQNIKDYDSMRFLGSPLHICGMEKLISTQQATKTATICNNSNSPNISEAESTSDQ